MRARERWPLIGGCLVFCLPMQSSAQTVRYSANIHGVVTEVTATYDPLYDPSKPPPPATVDPAFAQRFAVGQTIVVSLKYSDEAQDNVAADYWGRYPLSDVGEVVVDGALYELGPGVISIQTDQPYMPRSDNFFFHSYTRQTIDEPIIASGIWLDISIEGQDLFDSDSLVAPPLAWENAFGDLLFDSGLEWQRLRFSIDRVSVTIVPEIAHHLFCKSSRGAAISARGGREVILEEAGHAWFSWEFSNPKETRHDPP